ncbi:GNAT family N-acetyltransferase [Aeromicrobium sp. IC_218]|uniref:GNAT family N-acetyltransferase n=1 Tax=Aeromicrobium sp. IC_218 TaxID=2545468 RepID=UPI00103E16CE|nr:GNAT family N-acetyltransferase [Aeromicrobium sp. IC_218]TCI99412.1 GNAT family N-acetyltransferase [Aeromicrobium sp. IC_218]
MSLVIRSATTADVPEVVAFWAVAGENDDRPTDSEGAVVRLVERDPDALLLALNGDVLVGTVVAGWDGWRAHLYRLAVLPERRGQGVANALLDAAEERLVRLGAGRLDAMVLDGNELGQAVWRKRGFARQQRWGRWVKPVVR